MTWEVHWSVRQSCECGVCVRMALSGMNNTTTCLRLCAFSVRQQLVPRRSAMRWCSECCNSGHHVASTWNLVHAYIFVQGIVCIVVLPWSKVLKCRDMSMEYASLHTVMRRWAVLLVSTIMEEVYPPDKLFNPLHSVEMHRSNILATMKLCKDRNRLIHDKGTAKRVIWVIFWQLIGLLNHEHKQHLLLHFILNV